MADAVSVGRRRAPMVVALLCAAAAVVTPLPARAQSGFGASARRPRPTGRVSVYQGSWTDTFAGGESVGSRELITQLSVNAPDTEEDGVDYGVNLRFAGVNGGARPNRTSLYEAWAGARAARGRLRLRGGHLWLNDLGALGSLAGGQVEWRGAPGSETQGPGRFRIGGFAGLEPKVFDTGYFAGVRKFGVYGALDGAAGRRHSLGYIRVTDRSLTERAVISALNFVPVSRSFFLYQASEYDLVRPAGQGRAGLNYFYVNARANPGPRVQLQVMYNRGRSIDTRGLAEDVLNGRPVAQTTAQGLAYESLTGRVNVTPLPRLSVYVSQSRDKSNREDRPAHRLTFGGNALNVGGSGFDIAASVTRNERESGNYRSGYVSVGRQIGRRVYALSDYTTSVSVVQFARSDGLVVVDRPSTRRLSGTASCNVGVATTLQFTVDRVWDTNYEELRILSGVAYRFR